MLRTYNPNSGEHFYTASWDECLGLLNSSWHWEGIGWVAPKKSSNAVYRLYSGTDHHYTTSAAERDNLKKAGWRYEGIGWYSDDAKGVPLYRQYNPNVNPKAKHNNSGSHNYTTSKDENDQLVRAGWRAEGIGWYGISAASSSSGDERTYTATFVLPNEGGASFSDSSLAVQKVKKGGTAKAPEVVFSDPTYQFDGWKQSVNNVNRDRYIYAKYSRHSQYNYEIYSLTADVFYSVPIATQHDGDSGNESLQEEPYALYVKTDNPGVDITRFDGSVYHTSDIVLRAYNSNGEEVGFNGSVFNSEYKDVDTNLYSDIQYTSLSAKQVRGGFVMPFKFADSGTITLKAYEERWSSGRCEYSIEAASAQIEVESFQQAESKWIDDKLKKYTTSGMSPTEKMAAVSEGLKNEFEYLTWDSEGDPYASDFIALSYLGGTYFQNYHWDSVVSPTVLCKIAERIGGFEKIDNCYYSVGGSRHVYCDVTYNGKVYSYKACPALSTGAVDLSSVAKKDLTNTSQYKRFL